MAVEGQIRGSPQNEPQAGIRTWGFELTLPQLRLLLAGWPGVSGDDEPPGRAYFWLNSHTAHIVRPLGATLIFKARWNVGKLRASDYRGVVCRRACLGPQALARSSRAWGSCSSGSAGRPAVPLFKPVCRTCCASLSDHRLISCWPVKICASGADARKRQRLLQRRPSAKHPSALMNLSQ